MAKNIFIEGLQGAGKSTLTRTVEKRRPDLHIYREGDLCPVELAWCCYMTEAEYEQALAKYPDIAEEIRNWTMQEDGHYIVAYTRIITDYPGFHKYMNSLRFTRAGRAFRNLGRLSLTDTVFFMGRAMYLNVPSSKISLKI